MSKSFVRSMFIVVLVALLAITLSACGGSGNPVEKGVSDAVGSAIDTATGNVPQPEADGKCYNRDGLVAFEIACP